MGKHMLNSKRCYVM